MMKHKNLPRISLFVLSLVLLYSFNKCSSPLDGEINYSYEMYYLEDSSLSYYTAENIPIDGLIIQNKPFITNFDIERLTILYLDDNPKRSHIILLKDSVSTIFSQEVRPFVLILNGNRYFVGEYWPNIMSILPKSIFMYRVLEKEFHLFSGDDIGNSKLNSSKLIETLEKLGVDIRYENIGEN